MTPTDATAAIQRYTYRPGVYDTKIHDFRPGMEPNDQGDWVRHIDLTQALQAERRKLIDTIEATWCDGHDPDEKAERIVKWCRTQADKETL